MKCPVSICYNMSNLKIYKKMTFNRFPVKVCALPFFLSLCLNTYLHFHHWPQTPTLAGKINSAKLWMKTSSVEDTAVSKPDEDVLRHEHYQVFAFGFVFCFCLHTHSFALSVCPEFNSYIPREGIWQNCGTCHENVTISVNKNKSVVSVTHHHS